MMDCYNNETLPSDPSKEQQQQLVYNTWASENGTFVVSPRKQSDVTFNASGLGFFTNSFSSTLCQIIKYRIESVKTSSLTNISSTVWESIIKFENDTSILTLTNYTGVDPQMLGTTYVYLQARTNNKESLPLKFLTLGLTQFQCSNTSIVTPRAELPVMRAKFTRYDWFNGNLTFSEIKPVTLDMKTGFFDTGIHTNCSLTNFTLTKIKNLMGESPQHKLDLVFQV